MKTVALKEFVFATEDPHVASHGIMRGVALQYYGGNTGLLISRTPKYHRVLSSEKVNIDIDTEPLGIFEKSPLLEYC